MWGISCRLNSNSEVTLYCNVFLTIYANNIGFECQCHKKVRIRDPTKMHTTAGGMPFTDSYHLFLMYSIRIL